MFIKYRAEIVSKLQNFLSQKLVVYSGLNQHAQEAIRRIQDVVTVGKLLRGSLVLWSYDAAVAGKAQRKNRAFALSAACGLELFHNSLLIHDDVMDQDSLRRGRPSIHAQYGKDVNHLLDPNRAEHYGNSMAICAGDLGYFLAMELVPERVRTIISTELANVAVAQMQDVYYGEVGSDEPSLQQILKIYTYKTAKYSFSLPMVVGAVLGGNQIMARQLEHVSENVGVAFQIKDDDLGIFGTEEVIGKPVGSDIVSDKKTIHRHLLFERLRKEERKKINAIFGNRDLQHRNLMLIRKALLKYSVREDALNIAIRHLAEGKGTFLKILMKKKSRNEFLKLLDYLEIRER